MPVFEIMDDYSYGEWIMCSLCGGSGCQACSEIIMTNKVARHIDIGQLLEQVEDKKHPGGHGKPKKGK